MQFTTTDTEVIAVEPRPAQELLASIANKAANHAKLTNCFAEIYPIVQDYVINRCFGRKIELVDKNVRSRLEQPNLQEGIAKYMAREIAALIIERRTVEFEQENARLSLTNPFSWRRNLPPLEAKKTIFNFVATYNDFERSFAEFLDKAQDILRFAALGTTEQGASGTVFRIDYLKPSGAIGFYWHFDACLIQLADEFSLSEDTERDEVAVLDLAQRHNLTIYDASYLETAIRRKAKLATFDQKLAAGENIGNPAA